MRKNPSTDADQCEICLERVNEVDDIMFRCSRRAWYHEVCLHEWVRRSEYKCPVCHEDIFEGGLTSHINKESFLIMRETEFEELGYVPCVYITLTMSIVFIILYFYKLCGYIRNILAAILFVIKEILIMLYVFITIFYLTTIGKSNDIHLTVHRIILLSRYE